MIQPGSFTKIIISITLFLSVVMLASCVKPGELSEQVDNPTDIPQSGLPNPASVYCKQQGNRLEIRTAADGSQTGICIFPDGSECDEWAYFREECSPSGSEGSSTEPTLIPTPRPINPAEYQGWWSYTQALYNFSIKLPEDWVVEEVTTFDPSMSGHSLSLHPEYTDTGESIRLTFRQVGEDALLWPTGVGEGKFVSFGNLEIAGQDALRLLFLCPSGEIASVWYHQSSDQANIVRGNMEFGFIYSIQSGHCETGNAYNWKAQHVAEMIIASLELN